MKKRIVSFLILFSVFVSIVPMSVETKAEENPKEENKYGYIESNLKIYEQPSKLFKASNILPSRFDLREENGVTPIRDQNPLATCWAFASIATVESNIKYTTGKEVDLSEIDLAIDEVGIDGLNLGGNFSMSASNFASGRGAVLEKDNPYPSYGQTPLEKEVPASYNVNNNLFLPSRKDPLDNVKIKEAIINNGAVGISYNDNNSYLADDGVSYYFNNGEDSNHAVTLVGWDDNYPKEKFKNTPAGNGAFLVRNSWGTWFGDNGYFYISYYDTSLAKELISISKNTETVDSVDNRYTYGDYKDCFYYTDIPDVREQFIANVNKANNNELLSAVSISTLSTNASYEIYIDEDYNEINYPNGNTNYLLSKKRKTGILEYAGHNTIQLDSTIEVKSGKRFMVAVKYNDICTPRLEFIGDIGKQNSFYISGNQLCKNVIENGYGANVLTVYSYNKTAESATNINVDKTALSLKIGEKSQIKASAIGTNLISKRLKWTSSNRDVAVVDEDGVVTGRGNGNSTITVSNRSGSIKKTISVSINTNLSMVNNLVSMLKEGNYIEFDEKITSTIDYSKISLKDKDGKIIPITTGIDNRKLSIKVNAKYLGYATLSIPKNAINNRINKGLSSDVNLYVFVNSYEKTDIITLGSKDIMKGIAAELNKLESQVTSEDISNITYLNIYGTDIDFKDVGLLNSLTSLTVTSNGNSKNLKELKLLRNLEEVKFGNVNIINLNYLKNNKNLQYINMYNCGMFSLEGIEGLTNVTQAYFNNNYIKDIKGVEKLNKLEDLSLDNNQITDISLLSNCSQLEYLEISNNKLSSLKGIESLKKLKTIHADYNDIYDLTPVKKLSEITTNEEIGYLNINYNHIVNGDLINKYLVEVKKWNVYNYIQRADVYEVNNFNLSENSMNSKSQSTLIFNRPINKDWSIEIYKYADNYNKINIPFKIVGNKIYVENKLSDEIAKNNYRLYCNINYVDGNGTKQTLNDYAEITKTGFYTEDINKDNVVDIKDIATIATNYNERATVLMENWQYNKDLNLDGVIDIYDLVYVAKAM